MIKGNECKVPNEGYIENINIDRNPPKALKIFFLKDSYRGIKRMGHQK